MEQHEADLIRDLIKANRDDVLGRLDAQGREITEMKQSIQKLEVEYDAVLKKQIEILAMSRANRRAIYFVGTLATAAFTILQFAILVFRI
jgi:hypothetical protein